MKQAWMAALATVLLWTVLALLMAGTAAQAELLPEQIAQTESAEPDTGAAQTQARQQAAAFDETFSLPVQTDAGTESMDLHSYLTGVLLAELPASFAPEARKAQAVACRTYALRSYSHRRHEEAAVCTDSACCMGWTSPAAADPAARAAAEQAVRETDGLVILYGGALIDATFFSCSGGQTEAAAAVWGNDLPYLQPVASPGEEAAAHYSDETRFSLEEFCSRLRQADPEVDFSPALGGWVGPVTLTPGGGVDTIVLGGRTFRGTELRKLFSLRSTVFTLELTATQAVFATRGYGHRVGMSQYGADAMARAGKDFVQILTWYYQGVEIRPWAEAEG